MNFVVNIKNFINIQGLLLLFLVQNWQVQQSE